nr:heme-binding protein [Veillonella rogosae]
MTKLSQTALDYAQSIGVPIVVSIVDAKGVLMYFHRMSDALLISNDIAQAKAYTAVLSKRQLMKYIKVHSLMAIYSTLNPW